MDTDWLGENENENDDSGTAAMPTPALSPAARKSLKGLAASLAALFLGVTLSADMASDAYAAKPRLKVRTPRVDLAGLDAIAVAQEWRMAGDELPLAERLGGSRHPNGTKAWTAERLDRNAYLVVWRAQAGLPRYAFEVDLAEERVLATPEAVDALTALRVRDVSGAQGDMIVSAVR